MYNAEKIQLNSGSQSAEKIQLSSGSYRGQVVTRELGNIRAFIRWDNEYDQISGDFCADGNYIASFRADLEDDSPKNIKFRMVNNMRTLDTAQIEVEPNNADQLTLTVTLAGIFPRFQVVLDFHSAYYRELEINWYTPDVDLGDDLSMGRLGEVVGNQLKRAGVVSTFRQGLPYLPLKSPGGHSDLERWEERELHEALTSRAPAVSTPELWRLALLFVPRCDDGPIMHEDNLHGIAGGTRGMMFDRRKGNVSGLWQKALDDARGAFSHRDIMLKLQEYAETQRNPVDNEVVRQAAAIFYKHFHERVPAERREWECSHTILHEIGHIFNLSHHNMHQHEDLSVMSPTEGLAERSLDYNEEDIIEIRHGYFDDVAPGGATDFLGMSGQREAMATDEDHPIRIITNKVFHPIGEPVSLQVSLVGNYSSGDLDGSLRILLVKPYGGFRRQPIYSEYLPRLADILSVEQENGITTVDLQGFAPHMLGCSRPGRYRIIAGISDPEGRYLVYGREHDLWLVDRQGAEPENHPEQDDQIHSGPPTEAMVFPLGKVVRLDKETGVEAHKNQKVRAEDPTLALWQLKNGDTFYRLHFMGLSHEGEVSIGPDSIQLVGVADGVAFRGSLSLSLNMEVFHDGYERGIEIITTNTGGTGSGGTPTSGTPTGG